MLSVHSGECVHRGIVGAVQLDLSPVLEPGVGVAKLRDGGDFLVYRRRRRVAVLRPHLRAVGQRLVDILGRLRGEHRLAGVLVASRAHEALLVAVVDDGLAAHEEHHLVGEDRAGLGVALARSRDHVGGPAHVVIAEEGRLVGRAGGRRREHVVRGEEVPDGLARLARRVAGHRLLEAEVEGRPEACSPRVGRTRRGRAVVDLSEGEELGVGLFRVVVDLFRPLLPELEIHVLDRVDPESVDPEVHPLLVDVCEDANRLGVFRHDVVEPHEVSVGDRFAIPRRVAAVVVKGDVVELVGDDLARPLGNVRERRLRRHLGERADLRRIEGRARCVFVRRLLLRDVRGRPSLLAFVGDEVRRVVDDDVEIDLHSSRVGVPNELGELLVRPQMRVDLGEIGDPVSVVSGRNVCARSLHRPVFEGRREPNRRRPQTLDVVELRAQARDVASLIEALVSRVESGGHAVGAVASRVIGGVSVGEAVGHDEVEALAVAPLAGSFDEPSVLGREPALRGDPDADLVRPRIETESHLGSSRHRNRHVRRAVAPRIVHGMPADDLVLVLPGRKNRLVFVHSPRIAGHLSLGALFVPVAAARHLVLQAPDDGEARIGRRRRNRREGAGRQRAGSRKGGPCSRMENLVFHCPSFPFGPHRLCARENRT